MKQGIHPKYNPNVTITCACGASYLVGSTEENLKVEICSACHPFFTGKQKLVDTAGRVDKFRARMAAKEKANVILKDRTSKKAEKKEADEKTNKQ